MAGLLGKAMALQDANNSEILPKVGRDDRGDTSREDTTVGYYGSFDYGKSAGAGRTTTTTTTEKHSNLGYNKQAGQAAGEGAQDWKNPLVHRVICLVLLCFGLLFTLVGVERFLASSDNRAPKTRGKKGATAVPVMNTKTDAPREEAGGHSAHAALKIDDHHTQQDVGTPTKTREKIISNSDHADPSGVGATISGDRADIVPGVGTAVSGNHGADLPVSTISGGHAADAALGVGATTSGNHAAHLPVGTNSGNRANVVPGRVGTTTSGNHGAYLPVVGAISGGRADVVPGVGTVVSGGHKYRAGSISTLIDTSDEDEPEEYEGLTAGTGGIQTSYTSTDSAFLQQVATPLVSEVETEIEAINWSLKEKGHPLDLKSQSGYHDVAVFEKEFDYLRTFFWNGVCKNLMTHAECERDYKIGSGSSGHTWDIGKCRDGHSFQGKDCVAKYIGPGQYTTKTLATEVMLQHLLWTYFHTKKSNMPNCIPFVDQVIIEGAFGGAIIVMEKLAAAEPVQLYAAGGSDPLEHAERAFECLKILNNEIFVTHGDFKAANVGLATQGSDEGALRLIDFGLSTAWKVQNYPAAGSGFEVVLGAARDRKWQTEPQTVGRRGTPLLMHPHLNRIPSCFQVGTGVGAALPPTVGLHIDLYALAMALVSQRFGGLLSIEVRRVFGASLGYAFIEREQAKGEGLSSDDLDFLEPYLPCYGVESDARPPVRSQEYCSWQANFQQLAAEAYNEVAMGRASDAELARVRPVCYRGFRQHTIQRYLFNIFVDRVDPLDERLSVLVSRCLVFSATMNTKVEGLPLSQDGLAYVVAASYNTARGADVELQVVSTKSGSEVKVWLRSKVKDIRMSTIHHDIGYEYLVDHYGQATEASLVASYSGQATAGIGVLGPDPVWVPEARVRAASPLFLHGQTVIRYVYGQRFPNTDLDMDMDMDVAQAQHATVASSMWRPTIGQVCYMISFPSIDGPGREQEQHEVVEQNENGLLLFELGTSVWLWDASVGRLTEWRIESFQQHYPRRVISYKVVNELQQQERKDVETHLLRRLPLS